jgi:signal transduction histidine kinase
MTSRTRALSLTTSTRLHLAALAVLGLAGNYFGLPLYLGVDFLFGSIAALIALQMFGILAGTAVAAVAGSYTLVLWGHPYAAIIFTLEILFVGIARRRRRDSLVLLDGLFWLVLGFPLVMAFYRGLLHVDMVTAQLVALKQAVNGIFNALVASTVIASLPLYRRLRTTESVRDGLTTFMVALVLVPGLVVMVLDGRRSMRQLEDDVAWRVGDTGVDVGRQIEDWLHTQLVIVEAMATTAAQSDLAPTRELQQQVDLVKRTSPAIASIYVADAAGTTVAFWPQVNEKGECTVGLNFADREYFQRAKATRRPVVSNGIAGRGSLFTPIATISAPILAGGTFRGLVTGAVELAALTELISTHNERYGALTVTGVLTVVDEDGAVIASTVPERTPLTKFRRGDDGTLVPIHGELYRWVPQEPGLTEIARWRHSFFVQESPIGAGVPWRLIVEAPVAPLQTILYHGYLRSLAVLTGLLALTLVLSAVFSRRLVRPLNQLANLTADLPEKLLGGQLPPWPSSTATELDRLVVNFRSMALSLQATLQSLHLRTAEIEAIFESITDPTFVLGSDGRVLRANGAFCRLVHLPPLVVAGRPLDELMPGFAAACGTRLFADLLQTAEATHGEWHDPAGVVHKVHFFPIEGNAVARLQNVTGEREMEHRLLQSEKLASIGQLAAGVAHEINNPMAFILCNLNRLAEYASELRGFRASPGTMDDKEVDFLIDDIGTIVSECKEGAERIQKIVLDLKTFSRTNKEEWQYADLNQGIESTLNIIWNELKYRCEVVRDFGQLPPVICRAQKLNQVFMNLLMNAAQAIPEKGVVTIRTRAEGRNVLVSISDTGAGIPPENLTRIFDPFFTTKPVGQGTGLGLHLCYGIVRQHNGEIRVESKPGLGATFTVVLPLAPTTVDIEDTMMAITDD